MEKTHTVSVSDEVYRKLVKIQGELMIERKKIVPMSEVIDYLAERVSSLRPNPTKGR